MSETIPTGWSTLLQEIKPFGGTDLDHVLSRGREVLGLSGVRLMRGKRRLAAAGSFSGEQSPLIELVHSGSVLEAYHGPDFSNDQALQAFASVIDLALSSQDRRETSAHAPLMTPSGARDRLTDTIDRDGFVDYLDMELAAAPEVATVMMVGVDALDTVKETVGHQAGDQALIETAKRLNDTLRSCDVVSRVGADTFAIFCPNLPVDVAASLATRLQAAIAAPIDWNGSSMRVTASTGIATRGRGERTAALLEHSDLALMAAKENGSGEVAIYDGVIRAKSEDRRALASELVEALADNQLSTAFDPIVYLPKGAVVGVEAHVLWDHPTRGQIDRANFMGLAELIGRVDDVERAVLEFAIMQNSLRDRKVRTGFNLSASTLRDAVAVGWIAERLSQEEDHKIIVEIDEEVLLASSKTAVTHLQLLREAGAAVVLDNFGTGVASLRALHATAFDGVKAHSSLLLAGNNNRAASIIKGLYASAATAGFDVIHTGVETDDELRRLVALCESVGSDGFYAQGKAVRARVTQTAEAAA